MSPLVGAGPDMNAQTLIPSILDRFIMFTCFCSNSICYDTVSKRYGMLKVKNNNFLPINFYLFIEDIYGAACHKGTYLNIKTPRPEIVDKFIKNPWSW